MGNYSKAVELEHEFRKHPVEEQPQRNDWFVGELGKLGYTFDSYFREKRERALRNEGFYLGSVVDPTMVMDAIKSTVPKEGSSFVAHIPDDVYVYNGVNSYNKQYCEDNGIKVAELGYKGGTIVGTKYDVGLIFTVTREIELGEGYFRKRIVDWLKPLLDVEVTIDNNDIIVEGHKVSGGASIQLGNKNIHLFQISFKTDLNMIQNICRKEMKKVPKGIADFGNITRDDLIKEIHSWFNG